jgi:hypothetical protein
MDLGIQKLTGGIEKHIDIQTHRLSGRIIGVQLSAGNKGFSANLSQG